METPDPDTGPVLYEEPLVNETPAREKVVSSGNPRTDMLTQLNSLDPDIPQLPTVEVEGERKEIPWLPIALILLVALGVAYYLRSRRKA